MFHYQASRDSQKLLVNPAEKAPSLPTHPTELDLFRTTVCKEVSLQGHSTVSHLPIIRGLIYGFNSLLRGSLFSISVTVQLPAERKTHPRGARPNTACVPMWLDSYLSEQMNRLEDSGREKGGEKALIPEENKATNG